MGFLEPRVRYYLKGYIHIGVQEPCRVWKVYTDLQLSGIYGLRWRCLKISCFGPRGPIKRGTWVGVFSNDYIADHGRQFRGASWASY